MRFVTHNDNVFFGKYSFFPFLLGFMKFTAALLVEVTNVMIIIQSDNIETVIKDFVAFGFIVEIDDMMCSTVTTVDCSEMIADAGIAFPKY